MIIFIYVHDYFMMVININIYNIYNYNKMNTKNEFSSMYDNRGKYFDAYLFNKEFNEYIQKQSKRRILEQEFKTTDLENIVNKIPKPYELSLKDILFNTKNTWIIIISKFKNKQYNLGELNIDSIFYIGLTFIVVALLYILVFLMFS